MALTQSASNSLLAFFCAFQNIINVHQVSIVDILVDHVRVKGLRCQYRVPEVSGLP